MASWLQSLPASYSNGVLLGVLVGCLVLLCGLLLMQRTTKRLHALFVRLAGPGADTNLADALRQMLDETNVLRGRVATLEHELESTQQRLETCLQRVGFVRYDAFDNVGGKTSFSMAIVDALGTGLALSAVYNRHECRVYAKPLQRGDSELPLSDEEQEAVRMAGARQ